MNKIDTQSICIKIYEDSEKVEKKYKLYVEHASMNFKNNFNSIIDNLRLSTIKYHNIDDDLVLDFNKYINYI